MSEWTAEAARAAIEQAEAKLDALCQGTERFTMRIPADPEYDHDLVISRGLQAGKNALTALAAAEQRAAGLEAAIHGFLSYLDHIGIPANRADKNAIEELLAAARPPGVGRGTSDVNGR